MINYILINNKMMVNLIAINCKEWIQIKLDFRRIGLHVIFAMPEPRRECSAEKRCQKHRSSLSLHN